MSLLLPTTNAFAPGTKPRPVRYGDTLKAVLGGPSIDLHRLGDRWAIDVITAKMAEEPDGRLWIADLIISIGQDVRMMWPQFGLAVGAPGGFVVNGDDQQGSSLAMAGGAAGYTARKGQFFNLIHGGRRYLKMVTADTIADGGGTMTVPFWPMLRVLPSDGDAIDWVPQIEGVLSGQESGWTLQRVRNDGLTFSIEERD